MSYTDFIMFSVFIGTLGLIGGHHSYDQIYDTRSVGREGARECFEKQTKKDWLDRQNKLTAILSNQRLEGSREIPPLESNVRLRRQAHLIRRIQVLRL